jgi:hypothetical protein
VIIGYLPPLLALEDPELELFITKLVNAVGEKLYILFIASLRVKSNPSINQINAGSLGVHVCVYFKNFTEGGSTSGGAF